MPDDGLTPSAGLPDYGGTPLDKVPDLAGPEIKALEQLGFADAEQVLGALAVRDTQAELARAMRLSDADIRRLVSKLEAVAPGFVAEPMAVESPLPLGALPPDAAIEAMIAEESVQLEMAAAPLPPSVNHAARMPPLKHQGERGTCVAFALTAVHEYYAQFRDGTMPDLSEQFLYHRTKQIDGSPAICGTWQVEAAKVLGTIGQCREQVWRYNPRLPCNNNGTEPPAAVADAARYKLATRLLNRRNVAGIKLALFHGCVVGFSIPVYNTWFESRDTRRTGRITMRIGNEAAIGGHAMCLIGYQDHAQSPGGGYFILRNSWFGAWGMQCPYGSGNGTIPYAYIGAENWEAVTTQPPRPGV